MCIKVWLLDRMKEETSIKLDNMKDTKCEYGYAIRFDIPICVMPPWYSGIFSQRTETG